MGLVKPIAAIKAVLLRKYGRNTAALKGFAKQGFKYRAALNNWLQSYQPTEAWKRTAEYLVLGAIYLDAPFGRTIADATCARNAMLAIYSASALPGNVRMDLLNITFLPMLAHKHSGHAVFNLTTDRGVHNFLSLAVYADTTLMLNGKTTIALIREGFLKAWVDYHKDIWTLDTSRINASLNIETFNTEAKTEFIKDLMVLSMRHNANLPDHLLSSSSIAVDNSAVVINNLAKALNVSIEKIELDRLFIGLKKGDLDIEALSTEAEVWPGIASTEFVLALRGLLRNKSLLKLLSPDEIIKLSTGQEDWQLTIQLIDVTYGQDMLTKATAALAPLHINLLLAMPTGSSSQGDLLRLLPKRYEQSEREERVKEIHNRFSGIHGMLLASMDPKFVMNTIIEKFKVDILPKAEKSVRDIIDNNIEQIKNVRHIFSKILESSDNKNDEKPAADISDVLAFTGTMERARPPTIIQASITALKEKIRIYSLRRISEHLDQNWRTVKSAEVSFAD